jgi:hypothetical protein
MHVIMAMLVAAVAVMMVAVVMMVVMIMPVIMLVIMIMVVMMAAARPFVLFLHGCSGFPLQKFTRKHPVNTANSAPARFDCPGPRRASNYAQT